MCERCNALRLEAEMLVATMFNDDLPRPTSDEVVSATRALRTIVPTLVSLTGLPDLYVDDVDGVALLVKDALASAEPHDICHAYELLTGIVFFSEAVRGLLATQIQHLYSTAPDHLTEPMLSALNRMQEADDRKALLTNTGLPEPIADMLIALGFDVKQVEPSEE